MTPKFVTPTLVNFCASPAGDWQTGCLWWEVVESWFHVDLKSNFALKNNSMEFLLGPITRRINELYESRMKWTWHHSKLAVEEVRFFGGLKSGTPSTIIYTRWSSRRYELGCDAPLIQTDIWFPWFDSTHVQWVSRLELEQASPSHRHLTVQEKR